MVACNLNLGKNTKVTLGTEQVARINTFTITVNNENFDVTQLGDDWRHFCSNIQAWTAQLSGYLDLSDLEQNTLHSKALSGGAVNDIRFYENDTNYWSCDTATDSEARAVIENYSWNADLNGIVTFDMSFVGSGPITRT